MPIAFKKNQALLSDIVTVEEVEALCEWLQKKPTAKADLSACTHLHPACLQVLLAAHTGIAAWPQDATLREWLLPVLQSNERSPPS